MRANKQQKRQAGAVIALILAGSDLLWRAGPATSANLLISLNFELTSSFSFFPSPSQAINISNHAEGIRIQQSGQPLQYPWWNELVVGEQLPL